jgi:biotin carboxylase
LAGVVAVSDATVADAALLSAALGTPGPSLSSVTLAGDKRAMRDRLEVAGLPNVRWAGVTSLDDVRAVADEVGSVIVKPSEGSASRHVFRVDRGDDAVLEQLAAVIDDEPGWIAEQFLVGPEISVEALSWGGTHHVLAITDKETGPGFVELGHRVPATLTADLTGSVHGLVRDVLDALGFDHVISHTELILTPQGPRVVETHPRMGGDRIGRLVELATGRHPLTSLARALSGRPPTDPAGERGRHRTLAAAIAFVTAPAGTVTAVEGADDAAGSEGVAEARVTVDVGHTVAPVRSSSDRCGHVIATAPDARRAAVLARAAADRIRIETAPA